MQRLLTFRFCKNFIKPVQITPRSITVFQPKRWTSQQQQQSSTALSKDTEKDTNAVDEWNRTIKEAIEQAKRELSNNNQPNTPTEPPKNNSPKDDEQPTADFITTLGRVMQELPDQIEGFFTHGLDANIYAEQIRFLEPRHSGMHVSGRGPYMGVARVLRIAMNAYFAHPQVTIVSMRQVQGGEAGKVDQEMDEREVARKVDAIEQRQFEVFVRWVFEGVPRHSELIGDGQVSRFEGEFRYGIDPASGLISVHEVTAIHPAPPTGIFAS
ncbi:hypothetical protein H4R99_002540, partial [Coemansia sp. RSA 1722]